MISLDAIQAISSQRPFGTTAPFTTETQSGLEEHFESVAKALETASRGQVIRSFRFPNVRVTSFGKIFFPKPDGSSRHILNDGEVTAGIVIYLCRFASLAVWGCGTRNVTHGSTFYAECTSNLVYTPPKLGSWKGEAALVEQVLRDRGFTLPSRAELQAPMPFRLPFESTLTVGRPSVFDGLFYIY